MLIRIIAAAAPKGQLPAAPLNCSSISEPIMKLLAPPSRSGARKAPSEGTKTTYSLYTGYAHLGAGLTVGLSNLASGLAIGMCGLCGVQDSARQPKLYIGMVLIWSFGSALGLYGLIVALIIAVKSADGICDCIVVDGAIQCEY